MIVPLLQEMHKQPLIQSVLAFFFFLTSLDAETRLDCALRFSDPHLMPD